MMYSGVAALARDLLTLKDAWELAQCGRYPGTAGWAHAHPSLGDGPLLHH